MERLNLHGSTSQQQTTGSMLQQQPNATAAAGAAAAAAAAQTPPGATRDMLMEQNLARGEPLPSGAPHTSYNEVTPNNSLRSSREGGLPQTPARAQKEMETMMEGPYSPPRAPGAPKKGPRPTGYKLPHDSPVRKNLSRDFASTLNDDDDD